jgi:ankyrin repeat protein
MAAFLLSHGARLDIHSAAALGMTDEVESLLKQDPSLVHHRHNRQNNAVQPLHLAAWWGHTETVRRLLAHGADPISPDAEGKTPLMRAEQRGFADTARVMRDHAVKATRGKRRGAKP